MQFVIPLQICLQSSVDQILLHFAVSCTGGWDLNILTLEGQPVVFNPPRSTEWFLTSCGASCLSITVAGRSKAWTFFAHSNTGIVVSNPTLGRDVCVRLFCVCVLCVRSGLATGWCPVQGVLPTVWIKKLKKRPRSTRSVESLIDREACLFHSLSIILLRRNQWHLTSCETTKDI
jgi:hypothetical protein